jgi:4-amino-4-deoxy-L-arabinose transferase-like glycosyltransferase
MLLIFDLGRRFAGYWSGLWSALIFATSPICMIFSRAVIFDMPLAFFLTLALWAFARGEMAGGRTGKRLFLLMYGAIAAAVLTKGPIGVAIPALVIGGYLLVGQRRQLLGAMKPGYGIVVLLLIAAPWYLWAEARNPGYLHYFFFEENFLRYVTPRFNRVQPWYFYFEVLAIGFLPWTALLALPFTRASGLQNEHRLLVLLWAAVPFIFFSLSAAKQPGYILPAFPALALLIGTTITRALETGTRRRPLALPWLVLLTAFGYFSLGLFFPQLWPASLAESAGRFPGFMTRISWTSIGTIVILLLVLIAESLWARRLQYYITTCVFFAAFHLFGMGIFNDTSRMRSSRELAEKARPLITPGDQVVIYNGYLSSLPFYLRSEQPLWVVVPPQGAAVMGSFYIAEKNPPAARGSGATVLSFDKFAELWDHSPARLIVFVQEKKLSRLAGDVGAAPKRLLTVDDVVIVSNR